MLELSTLLMQICMNLKEDLFAAGAMAEGMSPKLLRGLRLTLAGQ